MTDDRHPEHNRRKEDQFMVIERHFVAVVSALILGSIIWVGSSLTDSIEINAKTEVRLGNIEGDIVELKDSLHTNMADRFTGKDADKLITYYDRRFKIVESWMTDAENRLDKLEQKR